MRRKWQQSKNEAIGGKLLAELNFGLGCALVFASEAKIEIEAKILFRLVAKKKAWFRLFHIEGKQQKSEAKMNVK